MERRSQHSADHYPQDIVNAIIREHQRFGSEATGKLKDFAETLQEPEGLLMAQTFLTEYGGQNNGGSSFSPHSLRAAMVFEIKSFLSLPPDVQRQTLTQMQNLNVNNGK